MIKRILGIDPGQRYFGIAIADLETKISSPYKILDLKEKDFLEKLKDIIKKEEIKKIVVGRPLSLRGKRTKETFDLKKIINLFKNEIRIPFIEFDERLTSKMADKINLKNKKKDHAIAAAIILQNFLDKFYG